MWGDKANNERKMISVCAAWLVVLLLVPMTWGQAPDSGLQLGDNTHLHANGLVTFGYAGGYGDTAQSNHSLNVGLDGNASGYYYNPNFLNFSLTPYLNQSRSDSNYQSLTDASGVAATANFFTGSHFPGSVSYHYDHNSTGSFGLTDAPNFTTVGTGQGLGISWAALLPGWPTLSVGYSQGSGGGTVYGTNEETSSHNRNLNLRSSYALAGFRLTGYFDHISYHSQFPQFLAGEGMAVSDSSGHDFGFGVNHNLPLHGSFYSSFNQSTYQTDYGVGGQQTFQNSYTTRTESAGANFNPTVKLNLFTNESFTDNLSGALTQSLVNTGAVAPAVNLGTGSNSLSMSGGASYQFTHYLNGTAQATHFQEHYFGGDFGGTFVSGSANYGRKLLNMFTFSGTVVDGATTDSGYNTLGFTGTVNFFRRFGTWETSGSFTYAQNVQTQVVTYSQSYYQYRANVHRRLSHGLNWTAAFSGTHSGLEKQPGSGNHSEGYSTSLGTRRFTVNGFYNGFSGTSILTSSGLVPLAPTPGLVQNGLILYSGNSFGGGASATPFRRMVISASYSRSLNDTVSTATSRNNTRIFNAQLQYHLRKIGFQAGYTRFTQGVSSTGLQPGQVSSFFVGASRWFDFF